MTDLEKLLAEFDAAPKSGPMYDDITAEEAAKRYSNRDLALFHKFNANGVRAEWTKLSDRLIKFGRGYAAYGDYGYLSTELDRVADIYRKRVNTIELNVIIKMIRETIERGNAFLAENNA